MLYEWTFNRIGNAEITNDILQDFWSNLWIRPEVIKTNSDGSAKNFLLHFYTFRILDYLKTVDTKSFSVKSDDEFDRFIEAVSYSHIVEEIERE